MKKFTLKEESYVPFVLTKEEYDTCVKVVKDTRAKELEKAFKSFCEVHQSVKRSCKLLRSSVERIYRKY